jgi:hypothetical protein
VCCSPLRKRKCERRTTAASGCIRHAAGALPDVKKSSYQASAPFCDQLFSVALVLGTSVLKVVSRRPQGYRVCCSMSRTDPSVKIVRACGLESRFLHRHCHAFGRRAASFGRPLTGIRDAGGSAPANRKSHPAGASCSNQSPSSCNAGSASVEADRLRSEISVGAAGGRLA